MRVKTEATEGTDFPPRWHMPAWMERYRELIVNTGGNSVEDMVNGRADPRVNLPPSTLQACVKSQVLLLQALFDVTIETAGEAVEIMDSSAWTAVWVWEVKLDSDLTLYVVADTMEHASSAAENAARQMAAGVAGHHTTSAVRGTAVNSVFIPAAVEPVYGDQAEFNGVIGMLDEVLSRLLLYAELAAEEARGVTQTDAHVANLNTLKHHAEDMLGAAKKMLRLFGVRVNVEIESGGALAQE
jgi:hypothetical protein